MWSLPNAEGGVRVESFQSESFLNMPNNSAMVSQLPPQALLGKAITFPEQLQDEPVKNLIGNGHQTNPKKRKKPTNSDAKKARLVLPASPNKGISSSIVAPSHFNMSNLSANSSASVSHTSINESCPLPTLMCDVCESEGTTQNLVK
jgi:hypothetical protein